MPSAPAAHPGKHRTPFEFRVRFPAGLAGAGIAPADPPSPPVATGGLKPAPAPAAPPAPPAPSVPPAPQDFWQTDAGRELQADRERIEAVLGNLQATVSKIQEDQAGRIAAWQRAAVELAMTVAARVLHDKVMVGEFPLEARVRDMIAQLGDEPPVTIHLNPADVGLLESRLGGEQLLPGRDDPRVVPDSTLGRGECRVESREGMLLSDVTRELEEIRDELLRSLGHART